MKIRNPRFVQPGRAKADKHRVAVKAFIDANDGEMIEFDAIRASFPQDKRADLTDGLIEQICIDLDLKVEP